MGSALRGESAGHQVDDSQQLREEIERTREHLGATVEQLAAKADVKSRVRAEAADLAGRVKNAGAKARRQAARAGNAVGVLGGKTAGARWEATARGQAGQGQLGRGARKAWQAVPGSARRAITKGGGTAHEKRVLLSMAAGAALAVTALVVWQRRKR